MLVTTFFGGGTAVTVTGNTFENNSYGIVGGYDAADISVVNATNNCFINNGLGFGSSGAVGMTLNATDNWWNSATGPVVDGPNGVSSDVVYTPFLITAPVFCGGSVVPHAGDFPNIGMVKISVEQAQPAYDSAGGSII